jgi:hypothetical protein
MSVGTGLALADGLGVGVLVSMMKSGVAKAMDGANQTSSIQPCQRVRVFIPLFYDSSLVCTNEMLLPYTITVRLTNYMPFLSIDKASKETGKSEITLRRLIRGEKIVFKKEKTHTGFMYLIDTESVLKHYAAAEATQIAQQKEQEEKKATQKSNSVRSDGGHSTFWHQKSEMYEEKYLSEVAKHSETKQELGLWRGRAEQAQSMVVKLLPAAQEVAVQEPVVAPEPTKSELGVALQITALIALTLITCVAIAAVVYIRYGST